LGVDQAKYFEKAHRRDHHKLEKRERLVTLFFGLGLAAAGAQVLFRPQELLLVLITLAPVVAALIGAFI